MPSVRANHRAFELENLEPRLLLSADGMAIGDLLRTERTDVIEPFVVVETFTTAVPTMPGTAVGFSEADLFSGVTDEPLESAVPSSPETGTLVPATTTDSGLPGSAADASETASFAAFELLSAVVLPLGATAATTLGTTSLEGQSDRLSDELTTTLRAGNGPPASVNTKISPDFGFDPTETLARARAISVSTDDFGSNSGFTPGRASLDESKTIEIGVMKITVINNTDFTQLQNILNGAAFTLSFSGTIQIAGFVNLSGTFSITTPTSQTATLDTGLAGPNATMTGVSLSMWSVSASSISAFVGVGGPHRIDTNNDGLINSADPVNPEAVGFAIDGLSIGLVIMKTTGTGIVNPTTSLPEVHSFYALKATASIAGLVGMTSFIEASAAVIAVNLNTGTPWAGSTVAPVVNFVATFGPGGYAVPATSLAIDYTAQLLAASADQVLFRISDFVFISGGLSLSKGPIQHVDVRTGLNSAQANLALSDIPTAAADPGGTTLRRSTDGSMIWNLPVETLEFGLNGVDVFVGYTDGLASAAADGDLEKEELETANAIGVFLNEISVALVIMRAVPDLTKPVLSSAQLRFYALQVDAGSVELLGVPGLTLGGQNLQVRLNQGSALGWPTGVTGPAPVVDYIASFGPGGLPVKTSTSTTLPIKWELPLIGFSADKVLLRISDFVYVSGGLSFNKIDGTKVDVRTGLIVPGPLTAAIPTVSAIDPVDGSLARTSDGSMIWNLPVQTIEFGLNNVDVFIGYTDSLSAAASDGELNAQELNTANAIGVFLQDVSLGMVVMRAASTVPAVAALQPRFFALRVDAALFELVGIPEFNLSASAIQVRVNQGSATWAVSPTSPRPVVDFVQSFGANGYSVQTATNSFMDLKWTQPLIGVSSDRVLLRISDFVYVSGGFSFNKGPVVNVDVRTGLTSAQAAGLSGLPVATDGSGTTLGRNSDTSMIWNLPVETMEFGLTNVDVFVGYTNPTSNVLQTAALGTGGLSLQNLTDAEAIGVFLDNASLGMVLMRALPVAGLGAAALNPALLKFFALQADASVVALVGIDAFDLSVNNLQVRLNQGSFVTWPAVPNVNPPPVVDFKSSFPDGDDGDSNPDGYRVQLNTSGDYKALLWDSPLIGASADRVLLRVSDFVYISGGFSFNKGPIKKVDVRTGLSEAQAAALSAIPVAANGSGEDLGRSSDGSMIWNLPVETIDFGLSNVDVFVGYTDPASNALRTAALTTGDLTLADLTSAKAIGVLLDNVNLGLVVMRAQTLSGAGAVLNSSMLKFFAIQGNADYLGLVGVPEVQLLAQKAEVRVNHGSFTPGIWLATGTNAPPVVDFELSFPDNSWDSTNPDGDTLPDGYRVMTNTSGGFIPLLFNSPLIAGGAEKVTIQISQFVYLTGSIYFEKGPVMTVPLAPGLAGDPSTLGVPSQFSGTGDKEIQTMTIGAVGVNAFVGLGGPYWKDSTSGQFANGLIDRDQNNNIIAAEVNTNAKGLVIDDLNFGLFIGTPTTVADPVRYVALKASAQQIALVGIEGLTASANGIIVELNLSSPAAGGLPLLPVINFGGMPGGKFGVKTGAMNGGVPVTIDLDMSTALVRAQGFVNLNILGSVYLSGSVAFALGPTQTVTLSNGGGTKTVTTMSIGVANATAFIGVNGPYWTDTNGNKSVDSGELSTTAVGFSVTDFDAGLLVMASTAPLDVGAYVALKASVYSFGLVNMPPNLVATGTFDIAINLGIGTSGLAAVDFVASFPATTNPAAPAGYKVNTGDASSYVLLNFTGPQVTIQLGGQLTVANVFNLNGVFLFDMNTGGLKLFADAALSIGPSGSFFTFNAIGVLAINSAGVAADIDLSMSVGSGLSSMALFNTSARLILNTSGVTQSVTIPQKYLEFLSPTALSRLSDGPNGTKLYTVSASAPRLDGSIAPAGSYLVVKFSATVRILGFDFVGNFQLVADPQQFQMTSDALLNVKIGTTTIFKFEVKGDFLIDNTGRIAAGIDLSLAAGFTMPSNFGLTWNVSFQMRLNTGSAVTLPALGLIENGFRLRASGHLGVPGLTLTGSFDLTVNSDKFTVAVDATISVFGTTLTVKGFAGLYYDNNPGFALSLQLSLGSNPSVTVSPFSGFTISGTFLLSLNTSAIAREGIAPGSFTIAVTNLNVNLFGFVLSGSLTISISAQGFSITIPQADPLMLDFFGFASLGVYGHLDTSGNFSFTATASINVGDVDVFGLSGSITVTFSNAGFAGSISATFGAFGIKLHASGSISIMNGVVSIAVHLSLQITPAFSFKVWTPWKTYTVHVPALVISGTFRFTFGYLTTATVVPPPPTLATLNGSTLRLNLGEDAHYRGSAYPAGDESYTITKIGENTIRVSAFGYNQDFTGVSHIVVNNTQSHNTFISVANDVTATVAINLGKTVSGENHFITGGGAAQIQGGNKSEWAEFGPGGGSFIAGSGQSKVKDGSTNNSVIVYAPGWQEYNLSDGSLNYGNVGGAVHTITFQNVKNVVLNGAANAVYEVSSLPDPATNIATPWTGNATFNGIGASSTVRSSTATSLTITNTALTESGVTITLNNLTVAELFGNDSSNTFTISGWTGNGAIDGHGGLDTVIATNDANFTLTNSSLVRNSSTFALANIEVANLTGGASANTFNVSNWTGNATLNGLGGSDTYTVGLMGSGSGTVTVNDTGASGSDTLTINGTSAADLFVISSTKVTRASETVNYAGLEGLTVNGLAGADTFTVNSTATPTTLNGGEGADTFTINATTAALTMNGDDGNDAMTVISAVGALTLTGGADDDTFAIQALGADSSLNTGSGVNLIHVGSTALPAPGNVNSITGKLTIVGGGTDTLNVNDSGDATPNTGQLTSSRLTGLGMGDDTKGIDYSSIETLLVALGSGGNTFNVRSTSAGTTTTVRTGSGSSTLNVGSAAPASGGNANGIAGRLNVVGQGPNDILNVDDSADSLANTGLLTSTRLTGLGMGGPTDGIEYTNVETLNISLGTGSDTFNVQSTFSGTLTTLNTGTGSAINTVNLGSLAPATGGNVNAIAGKLIVNGQSSSDTINVDDTGDTEANTALLTNTRLTGLGMGDSSKGLEYASIEFLNINLGSGDDAVVITSTHVGQTTVSTGAGNDQVNVATLSGETRIRGGAGDDVLRVNVDSAGNERVNASGATINGVGALLDLDGQTGSDTYTAYLAGTPFSAAHAVSLINVHDTGGSGNGTDQLHVYGSNSQTAADNFLIRRNFIALMPPVPVGATATAERINYDDSINAGVAIYGRAGNDYFAFDDNSTAMTVDGGDGNDTFQVGQMFKSERIAPNVASGDHVTTVHTTQGYLTPGVRFATTIYGGDGNDQFIIFSNQGALGLFGEDGDDRFTVRAFALYGSEAVDPNRAGTNINAGLGADLVEYNVNAPVAIDGGDGLDTLVVVGTEFSDRIVVTSEGVYGAGLFVTFTGIELIEIDGAEGNDHFSIVSTPAGVVVRLFGGLGSDTFDVGGSAGPVVSRDLQGHSGLIENLVVADDVAYTGIAATGVAVDVADKNAAGVVITQSGGTTIVAEVDYGIGLRIDSYTVVLTAQPASDVYITVSAPIASARDQAAGARSVQVYTDAPNAPVAYKSASRAIELRFTSVNWNQPQTVYVVAENDTAAEGTRHAFIQHSISTTTTALGYAGLALPNVAVKIIDDDTANAVLLPVDAPSLTAARIGTLNPVLEGTTALSSQSFVLLLTKAPTAGEQVTVSLSGGSQLTVTSATTLVFGAGNLDAAQAQLVTVRALDDGTVEGFHRGVVSTVVTSTGTTYGAAASTEFEVPIADTNSAGVLVLQSNGSTRVIEGGAANSGAPWVDSYSIALTQAPAAGQNVSIRVLAVPTPTTNAQLQALNLGAAANPAILASIVPQVSVSSTAPGAATQVIDGKTYLVLTFNAGNWSTPQVVNVAAIDDNTVDGGDIQAFARSLQTLDGIRGPLFIEGGIDPTADRTLPPPIMYIGETNPSTHVAPPNPNFNAIEADQIDSLWVRNNNAIAVQSGALTNSRLTGLGMGSDLTIGTQTFAGGITYSNLEMISVYLGGGADTFEILNTHGGETLVDAGGGNDVINVRTVLGHTTVLGGAGNDQITLGTPTSSALTIDRLRALVTVDGGTGSDTVTVDDRADTNHNVLTLDTTTISGLDLIEARVRIIELRNAVPGSFILAVDGLSTGTLSLASTAEQVRSALLALAIPGVSDLVVNRAGNTFTVTFLGDENLAPGALVVTGNASGLGPTAQIVVTNSSVNRLQTIALPAAAGTFAVTIGSGGPSFNIAVGDSADTVRAAIVHALNPTQAAAGVGVKDVLVTRYGVTYQVVFQGQLSGTRGSAHTFSVAPRATLSPSSFTINAIAGTFRLNVGTALQTAPLAWNASAADVQAALHGILGSSALTVTQSGSTYTVGSGVISGVEAQNLVAPIAVETRASGINYYGVDTLNLHLGQGADIVNVRGTSAFTNLFTHNGDDRVYVSSLAAETLTSATTTDFLRGNLDRVLGTLNLDLGLGRHLLMISDEAAIAGDGTAAAPVRITDQPVSGLSLPATEITITGLSPAPAITYRAAPAGDLADGITIWTGWGADVIQIDGTHQRGNGAPGSVRTITTLNTGLGNDTVTVELTAADGFFVLNTQGPENAYAGLLPDQDDVNASASTRPLVIFGGQDNDTIRGGQAGDIIFGDRGLVTYLNGTTVAAVLGNGGPGDRTDGLERSVSVLATTFPGIGGTDTLHGLAGRDLILGGFGNDVIHASGSDVADEVIVGDNGEIRFTAGVLTRIDTTSPALGGNDTITAGLGAIVAFGGVGDDSIVIAGDSLGDLLVGDNGTARFDSATGRLLEVETTAPGNAGNDTLTTGGSGASVVLGGSLDDLITTGAGDDIVVGDNGQVVFNGAGKLTLVTTTNPANGGNDTILLGDGNNRALGGSGNDSLTAGTGSDVLIGDGGSITSDAAGLFLVIESDTSGIGGTDTINAGAGNDIVIGGAGADLLNGEAGDDLIFGDNARLDFNLDGVAGTLDAATAIDTSIGAADNLSGGAGNDLIVGGTGGDQIHGDGGDDVVFGDFATLTFSSSLFLRGETTFRDLGGADTIRGGDGDDVLIGGAFADRIDGGAGDDLISGDNAVLDRTGRVGNRTSFLFQALSGTALYDLYGNVLTNGVAQNQPGTAPAWADFALILLDHSFAEQAAASNRFGNDYLAGGAGNDRIFGGLGNDTIQGDGSIDVTVSAVRLPNGTLQVSPSVEAATDGDDYIEGNGGNDVIFGGLGQDDVIGGSSNFFGLVDRLQRPDGSDLIFGGAGADLLRNDAGDGSANGHARDADVIAGDNAQIVRLVGTSGIAGAYLTFGYDNYGTAAATKLNLVPRAVSLLDYTPGGADLNPASAALDIGAADEIHGESGDDVIYGQLGNDLLFGEGQDDDLIGGTGADWISGGTGDDGVLGDDGRILTSRNGTAEPLYGMTAIPAGGLNATISTPGNQQSAVINVSGQLKKTAVLEPFMLTSNPTTAGTTPSNDIIFGGLGNDFLHGGAGDDAISGAEALPASYANPVNPGNILGYGVARPGEFAAYNEKDPLAKVYVNPVTGVFTTANAAGAVEFILNFLSAENDGDDVLFGDVGNDWLVGGRGNDRLYGGYGDDLMNVDDDLDTAGGRNNIADTTNYADLAFGGAGRDILLANHRDDRLIDWNGEFNSYVVPFNQFGAATVSRAVSPQLMEFLYKLSASDGADQTRALKAGTSAARNGEPSGELGLVSQQDADWNNQQGAPADPQPGNGGGNTGKGG